MCMMGRGRWLVRCFATTRALAILLELIVTPVWVTGTLASTVLCTSIGNLWSLLELAVMAKQTSV